MKVPVSVELVMILNEEDREVEGVCVECSACGHTAEAYGTGPDSVKRACCRLREECPMGESNFYYEGD